MIRWHTGPGPWRWGYEKYWSEIEKRTAHWVVLGPIAICIWFH